MYKDLGSTIPSTHVDEAAIKNSIRNIILTRKGSVPGKPNFGSNIYKIIFELSSPLTTTIASNYVYEALAEFENRIDITDVDVNFIEEYNKMTIDVHYKYVNKIGSISASTASIAIAV